MSREFKLVVAGVAVALVARSATAECPVVREPVAPRYPAAAKAARIQGTIVAEIVIDANGIVADILHVPGNALLAACAAETVRGWRFEALGHEAITTVQFVFSLVPSDTVPEALGAFFREPAVMEIREREPLFVPHILRCNPPLLSPELDVSRLPLR